MASSTATTSSVPSTSASVPTKKTPKSKSAAALDPVEIEAKRKSRAEKKEMEARAKLAAAAEAEAAGLSSPIVDATGKPLYKPRQWAKVKAISAVQQSDDTGQRRVKVLSWNMLAQGLVRRKLFPGSDALRWKDREAGLAAELTGHGWDVACLQEVDRRQVHAETLRRAGYSNIYAKGYSQKQHGLMLAWRTQKKGPNGIEFEQEPLASHTLFFDDEEISPGRTGCSRITRNIAFFAAIKFKDDASTTAGNGSGPSSTLASKPASSKGVILATTHLFWHPMHGYERVRQAGLLTRSLNAFRSRQGTEWYGWPTILAGDFNDQPHSASYGLLTGRGVDDAILQELMQSRVVHQSIDERQRKRLEELAKANEVCSERLNEGNGDSAVEQEGREDEGEEADADADAEADGEGEDEEGGADDQMLKNCRPATASDGLLTFEELQRLHDLRPPIAEATSNGDAPPPPLSSPTSSHHLRSAYATCYPLLEGAEEWDNLFSSPTRGRERWDDADWHQGLSLNPHLHLANTPAGSEPMWTLYSSLFSLTLDFIFLFPPLHHKEGESYPSVTQLLRTHRTEEISQGLPRKGICVSDHIAIGAELQL